MFASVITSGRRQQIVVNVCIRDLNITLIFVVSWVVAVGNVALCTLVVKIRERKSTLLPGSKSQRERFGPTLDRLPLAQIIVTVVVLEETVSGFALSSSQFTFAFSS